MKDFLECGNFTLQDAKWLLSTGNKLFTNFNFQKIITPLPLQETIFINNLLIEFISFKNEKKA